MKRLICVINKLCNIKYLALIGLCFCSLVATAEPYGHEEGYLESTEGERDKVTSEIVFVDAPEKEPLLKDLIFDDELTREFNHRYEQKFGRNNYEQFENNRFAEREYNPGDVVTVTEDQEQRQEFGNYVIKRLTEHHVDGYVKSNPSVRPVYELKEKISKVNVEVKKGYKLRLNYSYSGNYVTVRVENPYDIQTRLTLEMDPSTVGPSDIEDSRLYLAYPVRKDISVAADYATESEAISLAAIKRLDNSWRVNLTGSSRSRLSKDLDPSLRQDVREDRILLGLTWKN